jgi:hypothetical protein
MIFLLSQLDAGNFETLVKWMGLPGAILTIIIWAMCKKWIVPGWAYLEACEQRDTLQKKNDEMDQESRNERQKYLDLITRQQPIVERAVASAEKAVQKQGA